MTVLPLAVVGALLAVPAIIFLVLYFALRRRVVLAGVATSVCGAALAAFLVSAGTAMASSVDPVAAALRGAAIGFAGSAAVSIVLGLVLRWMR
jgi:hypothetical protein